MSTWTLVLNIIIAVDIESSNYPTMPMKLSVTLTCLFSS